MFLNSNPLSYHNLFIPESASATAEQVKVREEAQDDEDDYNTSFYQALGSLSLDDFPSSAVERKDDSPPSVVRIPKSYVSKSAMPSAPLSEGSAKCIKRNVLEEEKPNIRASSVPRPRAVLSSPDNDGIVITKNKTRAELLSGLKNHNSCQNRHIHCKVIPRSINAESHLNTRREINATTRSKSNPKGEKWSATADPSKRVHFRREKLHPVQS